ncbi:hypothetical protein N1851_006575 [Merluccius polli]|uniref:Alkylated DNA repair protein AlkB homologue 8 N-terminal domain-containing protein n=1 Tax=Merluccius polli TaxID=89951 RepID=A0AA47N5F7_MERPO|nr:hypothetical protein N1851_006575 [Merluccius polli]
MDEQRCPTPAKSPQHGFPVRQELYSVARSDLKRDIRDAKASYKQRIGSHFDNSDPCGAWQGIRHVTNYKNTNPTTSSSASLLEQLNHFFDRHETGLQAVRLRLPTQHLPLDKGLPNKPARAPPLYYGERVDRVSSFKFLGTHFSEDLKWSTNINSLVKKAQQWLYFLRTLRKVNLPQQLLVSFYRCSIDSVLTHGIIVWYGNSSVADKKALQRVINTAQKITNTHLPALEAIAPTSCILKDSSHPAHHLFAILPSGKHDRSIKVRTTRLINSSYTKAITTLNSALKEHLP